MKASLVRLFICHHISLLMGYKAYFCFGLTEQLTPFQVLHSSAVCYPCWLLLKCTHVMHRQNDLMPFLITCASKNFLFSLQVENTFCSSVNWFR